MKIHIQTTFKALKPDAGLIGIASLFLQGLGTVAAESISQTGSWPGYTRHSPSQVAADGNTTYLVGANGLQTFDLGNLSQPQALSFLPCFELLESPTDIHVQSESNRVCIGVINPNQLKGVDVSDPANPVHVWTGDLAYVPSHVCLDENKVYSSHYGNGLGISGLGITGIGGHYSSVPAWGRVVVVSNRIYVPTVSGFEIRDKDSPSSVTGTFNAGARANALAVEGNYAYLAATNGLHVVNIQIEATPSSEGIFELPGNQFEPTAIGLFSDHACLVFKKTNQLMVVNVATPGNPHPVGDYNFSGPVTDLSVSHGQAFVLVRPDLYANPDLHVLDLSDPSHPTLRTRLYVNGVADQIALAGTTLFVADRDNGWCILDVATPSNPQIIGQQRADGACSSTAASQNLACVSGPNSFSVYDVSNPANPVPVTNFWEPAQYLKLAGNYICRVGGFGFPELAVRDVNNNFAVLGTTFLMTDVGAFSTAGDRFALLVLKEDWSGPQRLAIIDVQATGLPTVTNYVGDSKIVDVVGRMDESGTNAFLATTNDLEILDLSDPNHIASVGGWTCPPGFTPNHISVSGNRIALAGTNHLWVIDMNKLGGSDPVIAETDIASSFSDMILSGNQLYAAAGAEGVIVYQIGAGPSQPRLFISDNPPDKVTLEWSAAGTGWFLQQSDEPGNPASWNTLAGSDAVTSTNLSVTTPSQFFRLMQP